jgi:hypothetical protein
MSCHAGSECVRGAALFGEGDSGHVVDSELESQIVVVVQKISGGVDMRRGRVLDPSVGETGVPDVGDKGGEELDPRMGETRYGDLDLYLGHGLAARDTVLDDCRR